MIWPRTYRGAAVKKKEADPHYGNRQTRPFAMLRVETADHGNLNSLTTRKVAASASKTSYEAALPRFSRRICASSMRSGISSPSWMPQTLCSVTLFGVTTSFAPHREREEFAICEGSETLPARHPSEI